MLRRRAVPLLVSIALLAACRPAAPPLAAPPLAAPPLAAPPLAAPSILVYGDSYTTESAAFLKTALRRPGWKVVVQDWPGTAPCDWLPAMAKDQPTRHPKLVVLAFAGLYFTPCIHGRPWHAATRHDEEVAAGFWRGHGVPVLWVAIPGVDPGTPEINAITHQVASEFGQPIADSSALLQARDGSWPLMLPCRPGEGPAVGCANGTIQVRRSATNHHLCPIDPAGPLDPCPVYSSGIVRWAGTTARLARAVLGARARARRG